MCVGFELLRTALEQMPLPVCDGSSVRIDDVACGAPETEQELSSAASEQMPLTAALGTNQEMLPAASEQRLSPEAPGTEQEPPSMASEQMLSPVVPETDQEPVACGVGADAVVCGAQDGAGAVA